MSTGGVISGDLDPLYKDRPVTLWVEDPLTRDYLKEAWADPMQLRLLVAGNKEAVRSLVASARQSGYSAVFGLCDRDFGRTNHGSWSATTTEVFRLSMHEIENALLDATALSAALAAFGKNLGVSAIDGKLRQEASAIAWGMALGSTLSWLRETLTADFPASDALVTIVDQAAAEGRIFGSNWWQSTLPNLPTTITQGTVRLELGTRHAGYSQDLNSGAFLETFAGKELLGRAFAWLVNGCGRVLTVSDLAKGIGAEQRRTSRLPPELVQLRALLIAIA